MVNEIGQNFGTSFGVKIPNLSSLNKKKIENLPEPMSTPAPTSRNVTPNLTASKLPMQDTGMMTPDTGAVSTPGYGADFDTIINRQMEDLQKKASKIPQVGGIDVSKGFNVSPIAGINAPTIGSPFGAPIGAEKTIATPETVQSAAQEINKPVETTPMADTQVIGELGATIQSNPDMTIEDLRTKFPEYSTLDDQVLGELGATIQSNPEITVEEIQQKFPELSGGEQPKEKGFIGRLVEGVKGTLQQGAKFGEGAVGLLDKVLGTEGLGDVIDYSYRTYGMSPKDLKEKQPEVYQKMMEDMDSGKLDLSGIKTTVSQDILNVGEGALSMAQTAAAPGLMAGFTAVGATKPGAVVLEKIGTVFGGVGRLVNFIPGLSDFRNSLPEEDQSRFDNFVGNVVGSLLLGTKGKKNIIKNPKQFVLDNVGSKQIIDNFKQNVIGVVEPIKKGITVAKEKLTPGIKLDEASIKKAQENPYVAEHLNKIHAETDGNMAEVPKTYKDTAVKEVGDIYIKPELDAKIEAYKEGGSLYQKIRATKQNIDVSGLDAEAKTIAEKYPKSTLTPTDTRNINNALAKVDDIISDSKEGRFDVNAGLDTRQSFDAMIDWEGASAKGNEAVKAIRKALDDRLKKQVAGLAETDKLASKKIGELKEFKKQLINKEGNINYANLKNVKSLTKTDLARRLDEFVPGATDRIEAINSAIEIAKKTKGLTWAGKLGAKGAASALGMAFGGPLGAAIGLLLEPLVEGTINKKLGELNQTKVLKMFENLTPEAKTKLETIGKKIQQNADLSSADQLLIDQARNKYINQASKNPLVPIKENGTITSNSTTDPISKGGEMGKGQSKSINEQIPQK